MTSKSKWLSAPYALWSVVFILIPLGMIFYYGLTDKTGAFTLENITAIASAEHAKALWLSLLLSLISTIICFLLAYPLAMILANMKVNQHSFIILIFILPMWMNFMLRTLAWRLIFLNNGFLNAFLQTLGLGKIYLMNTKTAIIIGTAYDYFPFMVLPIYNALVKIPDDVINAAKDLGAGWGYILRRIIIPLSLPGVVSGITMVLVPSMSEFVIASMLGGGKVYLIGNVIEQAFNSGYADTHLGSGLSLSLMGLIIISMVIYRFFDRGEEENVLW